MYGANAARISRSWPTDHFIRGLALGSENIIKNIKNIIKNASFIEHLEGSSSLWLAISFTIFVSWNSVLSELVIIYWSLLRAHRSKINSVFSNHHNGFFAYRCLWFFPFRVFHVNFGVCSLYLVIIVFCDSLLLTIKSSQILTSGIRAQVIGWHQSWNLIFQSSMAR